MECFTKTIPPFYPLVILFLLHEAGLPERSARDYVVHCCPDESDVLLKKKKKKKRKKNKGENKD